MKRHVKITINIENYDPDDIEANSQTSRTFIQQLPKPGKEYREVAPDIHCNIIENFVDCLSFNRFSKKHIEQAILLYMEHSMDDDLRNRYVLMELCATADISGLPSEELIDATKIKEAIPSFKKLCGINDK